MKVTTVALAGLFARTWARLYTYGLPAGVAERRLAEIRSDLWEYEHDSARHQGLPAALNVLRRFTFGMGHDVAWRLEQECSPATSRRLVRVSAMSLILLVGLWVVPLWSGKPHQHCVSQQQAGASSLNPSAACECQQRVRPAGGGSRTERRDGVYMARVICRP